MGWHTEGWDGEQASHAGGDRDQALAGRNLGGPEQSLGSVFCSLWRTAKRALTMLVVLEHDPSAF